MTDLGEARGLVAKIEADLARNASAIERLAGDKRSPALAAARGDAKARRELAGINEKIRGLELHGEDLRTGLDQARGELSEAEAAERLALDRERADEVERLACQLAAAAGEVDGALVVLAQALEARGEVAQRLMAVLPGEVARELSHKLAWGPVVRAARAVGLSQWLRLPHYEAHHCVPLRAMFPIPEISAAVAKLRGDVEADRRAA